MASANVFSLDGKVKSTIELPAAFSERVRPELILRAVIAENTYRLQPQGHFPLAGMQTTARYYGAMSSYRSGRHMGIAIRPREKLGGGIQGKVKRIPSAVKGKRAHPHLVEKRLIERINKREYQAALASAISATASTPNALLKEAKAPIVFSSDIESVKKSKEIVKAFESVKLAPLLEKGQEKHLKKGIRRSSRRRLYKKTLLLVVSKESPVVRATRNLPGVDVCTVSSMSANLLAPGGRAGRFTVWSEGAIKELGASLEKYNLNNQ